MSETAKDSVLFVILDLTFTSSGSSQYNNLGGDGTTAIQLLFEYILKLLSTPTSNSLKITSSTILQYNIPNSSFILNKT